MSDAIEAKESMLYRVYFCEKPSAEMKHRFTCSNMEDAQDKARELENQGFGTEIIEYDSDFPASAPPSRLPKPVEAEGGGVGQLCECGHDRSHHCLYNGVHGSGFCTWDKPGQKGCDCQEFSALKTESATETPIAPSPVEETAKPCDCEDACDDDMLCLKKGMYCRVHNAPIDPCPFCGTAPEETHSNDKDYFYVGCANEDCMVQPETGLCKSEEEARKAWNWKLVAPSPIPSATEQTFENWWGSKVQYELARSLEGQDDCYECCKSYAAAAWNAAKGISR